MRDTICAQSYSFVSILTFFILFLPDLQAATRNVTSNSNDGAGTLRQAIGGAVAGDVITFDASVTLITLTAEILISTGITIQGNGADVLDISGGNSSRIFRINSSAVVTINSITIRNGRVTAAVGVFIGGAGVYIQSGTLNINDSEVNSCVANDGSAGSPFGVGGAIICTGGSTLTARRTTFQSNSLSGTGSAGWRYGLFQFRLNRQFYELYLYFKFE